MSRERPARRRHELRESYRAPIARRSAFPVRAAVRLAWRLSFARWGRAVLIIALVGVPIAGLAAGTVLVQSTKPTVRETLDHDLGHAAARMTVSSPDLPGYVQDPADWQTGEVAKDSPLAKSTDAQTFADLRAYVPDGARAITVQTGNVQVDGPRVPIGLPVTEGASWSPVLDGHWRVLEGRTPRDRSEAMVTPATLERLDGRLGDGITLTDQPGTRLTIVGTMRDLGDDRSAQGLFVPSGTISALRVEPGAAPSDAQLDVYLPDHSIDWAGIRQLNRHGIVVESRAVVLDPPPTPQSGRSSGNALQQYGILAVIGTFALFQVGLLAAAAFLVSGRADTRTHAIVASVGGDRRFLFTVVSGSGLVLGALGAVGGVVLGSALGAVAFHALDDGSVTRFPGVHFAPVPLGLTAVAGIAAGWVASLVAARTASRVDVLAALRGAGRPVVRPRRRGRRVVGPVLVVLGALMTVACGTEVLLLNDRPVQTDRLALVFGVGVALGPCLAQLGVVLCAPALLAGVARLAARWGLSSRIAVRDAVRNPVRTVPVLASVMSVVFVATVAVTFTMATQAQTRSTYEYRTAPGVATSVVTTSDGELDAALTDRATSVMRRVFPDHSIRVLSGVQESSGSDRPISLTRRWPTKECPADGGASCGDWLTGADQSRPRLLVGSAQDLALLIGRAPSAAARDALARGDAVALRPEFVHRGHAEVDTWRANDALGTTPDPDTTHPIHRVRVPAVLDEPDPRMDLGIFMTPAGAERHGVDVTPMLLVTRMSSMPDPARSDDMTAAWLAGGGADRDQWTPFWMVESGPQDFQGPILAVVLALAAVVTLAATSIAVGLARADAKRDDEVLDAIGAPPRLRRRVATWQAAVVTVVGSVVGVVLGVLPLRALTLRFHAPPTGTSHMAFAVDPVVLAVLAIGLPLVVTLGVFLTSGRRGRIAVRRTA